VSRGPLPELLISRRDRPGSVRWHVEDGPVRRGEAWSDVVNCSMRVPFRGGAHGRLVRAHELMHARVSPLDASALARVDGVGGRSVECAEELRVNLLLGRVGFELAELRDGSERLAGRRLAESGDWPELVRFSAALAGTRALKDLVQGVRTVEATWASSCRALERELLSHLRRVPTVALASTVPTDQGLPTGFATHTVALAELIERWATGLPSRCTSPIARARGRPARTGEFAALFLDDDVVFDRAVRGAIAPARRPAQSGRRVVRPGRLVTDPTRRVFDRAARGAGGVVVVDQSGSMSLDAEDLARLLAAAPGAFVLGYSHDPGSVGVANAWVLADRGRATSAVRAGNVGNGVDGPALRHALSRRRAGEPVLWVTDGQVTDSGDHADLGLAAQCARLVVRHGIAMVPSVDEALAVLRRGAGRTGAPRLLGRVGAAVTAPS